MRTALRFLLAGCGHIGRRHARIISEQALLCAVCDIDEDKAMEFSSEFGVPGYQVFTSMLEQVPADAVAICTPNGLHAVHSIEALNHKIHVLCEKPMAISGTDCKAIIEAAEQNNRLFQVVKQNRHNPPVKYLRKLLDEGRLGKIYSIQVNCFWNRSPSYYQSSWKGSIDLDGGVLFTQFSHFIDILYWLFGGVRQVQAISRNSGHRGVTEFDDNGIVALEFENGAIGGIHYTTNACVENMEGSLTVFAEKGTIKIGGRYLNRLDYHQVPGLPGPELPEQNPPNRYGTYEGSMGNHAEVYREFILQLESGRHHSNSWDAFKTVEIIEQIHTQSRTKKSSTL